MSNFIEKVSKNFDEKDTNKLEKVYNFLKQFYNTDGLYTENFAENIAKSIINNRLDIDSAIIGLLYPAYKIKPDILNSEFISDEITSIFVRLEKIENLNLSTHQEQLENIKKMFIALAKDIRVIIIKLCIEEAKLNFLDKFSDIELEKYMKEVSDVYFPISQMLGLSKIKNSFGNATFKYYKPQMYDEL